MTMRQILKLEEFEERHPGACRQVEAMFRARIPLPVIAAALQVQYGEQIGPSYLYEYKWECQIAWGLRMQAKRWAPQEAR